MSARSWPALHHGHSRRLVILTTAGTGRLRAAISKARLDGYVWTELAVEDSLPGESAFAGTVPALLISQAVADIRARLHGGESRCLVGAAVADHPDLAELADNVDRHHPAHVSTDRELLHEAAAALVGGYGVVNDRDQHAQREARAHGTRHAVIGWPRRKIWSGYHAMTRRQQRWSLVVASMLLGIGLPFAVYSALYVVAGIDVGPVLFWVIFAILILTAASIYAEGLRALEPDRLPGAHEKGFSASDPLSTGRWPTVSLIVAAYLPNESGVLPETVENLLAHEYPGRLEVVIAANGSGREADRVLAWLRQRAVTDARLKVVLAPSSTSKAENVNAGLDAAQAVVDGGIVGVLDADHQLATGACERAARWVDGGYADVVQGHNVIRNGDDGWREQMVAVEFEAIYAVAHPGRAGLHGFGIFGGSNGFWRADLLDRLRMRPWLLTEDIDVTMRALRSGAKIVSDPRLVSRELAPETLESLWGQRTRWAQGWHQVSRLHLRGMLRSPVLNRRQKMGASFLLGWREVYPWLSMQMIPLVAYQLLVRRVSHFHWALPFFVFSLIATSLVGSIQALLAWRLAVPELRQRRSWFLRYLFLQSTVFGEAKSLVNRTAHLREWVGDDGWVVTPRGKQHALVEPTHIAHRLQLPQVIDSVNGVVRERPLTLALPRGSSGVRASGLTRKEKRSRQFSAPVIERAARQTLKRPNAKAAVAVGATTEAIAARPRWGEIEVYRVIAALLVVAFHVRQAMQVLVYAPQRQGLHAGADYPYENIHWFESLASNFDVVVDFFFCLSGFLLALPWLKSIVNGTTRPSLRAWAGGRLSRAVPITWVLVVIAWSSRNYGWPAQWQDLLEHLTFTQWFDSNRIFYTIGPAWSLSVELWLYPLIPLLLVWSAKPIRKLPTRNLRIAAISAPILIMTTFSVLWLPFASNVLHEPLNHWSFYFGMPAKADEFGFGMLLALLLVSVRERRMAPWVGVMMRIGAVGCMVWFLSHRVADQGNWALYAHTVSAVGFAVILGAIVLTRPGRLTRITNHKSVLKLGSLTFALYISHEVLIDPLFALGWLKHPSPTLFLNWAIFLPTCFGLAWLLHHLLETPFMRLRLMLDHNGRAREFYPELRAELASPKIAPVVMPLPDLEPVFNPAAVSIATPMVLASQFVIARQLVAVGSSTDRYADNFADSASVPVTVALGVPTLAVHSLPSWSTVSTQSLAEFEIDLREIDLTADERVIDLDDDRLTV